MASQKGGQFERKVCGTLSLWWSNGHRDDLFWRTGGSGGRAKRRGRGGKQTHGQHGDIMATHPKAELLIRLLTIELKRGYNKTTIASLLDKPSRAKLQEFESWILQAQESHEQAKSKSWMIIHKRDMREAVVYLPFDFWNLLELPKLKESLSPFAAITVRVGGRYHSVVCLPLSLFLHYVSPKYIRENVS